MVASRDWERQKQLFEKQYISQAALERAQGQRDTALARLQAAQAQARVASHQSHFYEITAPYDGVVSELNTALGDMALPGKVLLTVYDPRALRLRAFVPQSLRLQLPSGVRLSYELPQTQATQAVTQYDWLPVADPGTHSVELRIPLQGLAGELQPGQFARVWLPVAANPGKSMQRLWIPLSATLRRAEMDGVYVQKPNGELGLRQVRLGEARAGQVEVLSGLDLNERVVRDARVVSAKAP
jgi:RND family efflux transporter MFP subunit